MPRFSGTPIQDIPQLPAGPRFRGTPVDEAPVQLRGTVRPMSDADRSESRPSTNLLDENGRPIFRDGAALNAVAPVYGAVRDIAGGAVDRVKNVVDWGIVGKNAIENALTPEPRIEDLIAGQAPNRDLLRGVSATPAFGGTETFNELYDALNIARPERIVASSGIDELARAAGEGATLAALPEAAVATGAKLGALAPRAVETLAPLFGSGSTAVGMVGNAVAGAGAGVGAKLAADASPDGLDPIAALIGGVAGGGVGAVAAEAPKVAQMGARAAADFVAPLSQSGQKQLAGRTLHDAAESPGAVLDAIDNRRELVPGSEPTTAQLTGDMGLLGLERGAQTKDPVPFAQRRADQNAARLDALETIQPEGTPEAVIGSVRQSLAEIDQEAAGAVGEAGQSARSAADKLGAGSSPDAAGDALRSGYEAARARAKAKERALWDTVDPDGTLALPAAKTRSAAAEIARTMPQTARPMDGEEAAIFQAVGALGDVAPFSDLTALQSRVKTEMRSERIAHGESEAYRRLVLLNGAVQADLEGAIAQKVAQEQRAVAAGEMRAEDTLEANFRRQMEAWRAERGQVAAGDRAGAGTARRGSVRSSAVAGVSGATGEGQFGPSRSSSNQGLPEDVGRGDYEPVDPATLNRLSAARAATRERAETFDNPTLAPIRRREMATGPYAMPTSAVPGRIFFAEPQSFDAVKAYRKAVGDDEALRALTGYAVDRLRRAALSDDGTFDPAKLAAWRRSHSDALRAFPELDAAIGTAGRASETLTQVSADRAARRKAAELGAVGRLVRVEDPADVVRIVGSIFSQRDAVAQMTRLRAAIGNDEAGRAGLRRAIVECMAQRLIGNTEAAASGKTLIHSDRFQTFVKDNQATLHAAGFDDAQIDLMGRIAADLQQSNRSATAARLPGGSNTAQDTIAARAAHRSGTALRYILTALAGGGAAGAVAGAAPAVAGAIIAPVVQAMRNSGLQSVDELVREALLYPTLARLLLSDVKARSPISLGQQIANRLMRGAAIGEVAEGDRPGTEDPVLSAIAAPRRELQPAAAAGRELVDVIMRNN